MTTQPRIKQSGTRTSVCITALLVFGLLLPGLSLAQPGTLDTSFGTDGIVTTDFGFTFDWGTAVDVQPNGKIVVAGFTNGFANADFALARYNTDGSLDTDFSADGKDVIDFGASDIPEAVVVLPNGKIVVAGRSGDDIALARYNKDGNLDAGFGADGLVTTDFGPNDKAWAVAVQPNGKIVVAGETCGRVAACDGVDFALVRYNKDGSLDTDFGADGLVTTDVFGFEDQAFAVAVRPNGQIVAGGTSCSMASPFCFFLGPQDIALAQYNKDGSLDTDFGTDGIVTTDVNPVDVVESLAIQPNGKIVVTGRTVLARYNKDGSLDADFGADGLVTTAFDDFTIEVAATALALQPNGKIAVLGNRPGAVFALARYHTDGSPDTGFGPSGNGLVTTPTPGGVFAVPGGLAIQTDGHIVAAGVTCCGAAGLDYVVLRYQGHEDEEALSAQAGAQALAVAQAAGPGVPEMYTLAQNYPNPFNPTTTIRFALPESAPVRLAVHDMVGRTVEVLVDGVREAGTHEAVFAAHNLPSGPYVVRLETPQGSFVRLMQLVK